MYALCEKVIIGFVSEKIRRIYSVITRLKCIIYFW